MEANIQKFVKGCLILFLVSMLSYWVYGTADAALNYRTFTPGYPGPEQPSDNPQPQPKPPTSTPIPAPQIKANLRLQVYQRPSYVHVIGILNVGEAANIFAQDGVTRWYQIDCSQVELLIFGPDECWVTNSIDEVTAFGDLARVPFRSPVALTPTSKPKVSPSSEPTTAPTLVPTVSSTPSPTATEPPEPTVTPSPEVTVGATSIVELELVESEEIELSNEFKNGNGNAKVQHNAQLEPTKSVFEQVMTWLPFVALIVSFAALIISRRGSRVARKDRRF